MSMPTYDEIRRQVGRRYRRRTLFALHFIIAVTGLAVMWLVDPSAEDAVLSLLWTGLLTFHGIKVFVLDEGHDRAIERMWERYGGDVADEKPKRTLRLSDDAEFEVVDDEFDLRSRKLARDE